MITPEKALWEELKDLRDQLDDAYSHARSSAARGVIAVVQERLVNLAQRVKQGDGR